MQTVVSDVRVRSELGVTGQAGTARTVSQPSIGESCVPCALSAEREGERTRGREGERARETRGEKREERGREKRE